MMDEVEWLSPEESSAWRGFLRMHQLVNTQVERDLWADSRLSGADYAVLVTLSEDPERQVRMTDLARRITWSKSRLSHQVSRMEKRGLVERQSCGEDGRGAWLCLTAQGLKAIEQAAPAHVESVRRNFISLLNDEHIGSLGGIAKVVAEKLGDVEVDEEVCDGIKAEDAAAACDEAS